MHHFSCAKRNSTDSVEEMLKDKRSNVNIADCESLTALSFAINFSGRHLNDSDRSFRETFQIERMLLKKNADINHQDIYGRTAAHYIFVKLRERRCTEKNKDPIELVSDLCGGAWKKVNVDVRDMYGYVAWTFCKIDVDAVICSYFIGEHPFITRR